MRIGPATCLPTEMVRPDVLLCLGEEWTEFEAAMDATGMVEPGPTHRHRAFTAEVRDGVLCLAGGLGSAIVETSLWELARTGSVERILLVGTAGALEGYRGAYGAPHLMDPAHTTYQSFDAPPQWQGFPTWDLPLPRKPIVSTDRFYGFSPHAFGSYPAEPGLQESWSKWHDADAFVDMEVAAFYWHGERFGIPKYAAIKAAANPLTDLDSLPDASAGAMAAVVAAAVDALAR